MKRMLILLFVAFLLSTPVASSQMTSSVNRQTPAAPSEEAVKSQCLFFQLSTPAPIVGPQALEFRVLVDGAGYLVERITLSPDEARQNPAVELLSREPDQMKKLHRLAKKKGRNVQVTVMLNGQVAREFSFAELLSYNRDLKLQESFHPIALQSRVLAIGAARDKGDGSVRTMQTSGTCESECGEQYAYCAEYYCGSPTAICGPCLDDYNNCLNSCPPPPPPTSCPSTSCSSTTQVVGATWYGSNCLYNVFQQKKIFDSYLIQYKKTTTCTTTDPCAGTQSSTVSVEYFYRWCDVETWMSCGFPNGWAFACY